MVGWPPDTRPPLGKGPTGKDRPKGFDSGSGQSDFFSSHDSETDVADSSSPRTSSLSPSDITTTPSRQMQVMDESWDQALIMNEHQSDVPSSSESTYQLSPMTSIPAPIPSKALSYPQYASSLPSSSRNSTGMSSNNMSSSNMYIGSPASYPNAGTSERTMHHYSSNFGNIRGGDMRVESPRHHYSYSQSPYPGPAQDPCMQTPPPVPVPGNATHQSAHRESSTQYGHRRSLTDSQTYTIGQGFPHLPNPAQLQQNIRLPDMHRLPPSSDSHDQQQTYRTIAYGPDGRLNSLP